ncbi:MAG: hypothetical protein SFV21_06085, partial [Rhodospirillaceae bacterium]|nr:hypothetical protein [Rhodospirillaceae bacterium]
MFNYTISLQNPYADMSAYVPLIEAATAAALDQWGRYFVGLGTLDVAIELTDYGNLLLAGGGRIEDNVLVPLGGEVYRFSAQQELLTGVDANGAAADFVIEVNTAYIRSGLFSSFDLATPPTRGLDFLTFMMHELGHPLGIMHFAGSIGARRFEMDQQITRVGDAYHFIGPIAVAAHGGPVPMESLQHIHGSVIDLMSQSMWSYRGRAPSLLDLAILHDLGYDFVPEGVPARLSASNRTAGPGTVWNAGALFTSVDIDGDAAVTYQFQDASGGGFWTLDGLQQGANFQIDATDLGRVQFRAGFRTSDQVAVRSFDGANWSNWANFTLATNGNTAPSVVAQDRTLARNQVVAASGLFTVGDADGDPLTIELLDATTDPNGGYWTLNGVRIARNTATSLGQDQLASLSFVAQASAGVSQLRLRAGDGTLWSDWEDLTVTVPGNHAPIVTAPNVTLARNQAVRPADLFVFADPDGDALMFAVRNETGDTTAGYWMVDGERLMGEFVISQGNLHRLSYQVGSGGSNTLSIRATDGMAWSGQTTFQVNAINQAPTVTAANLTLGRNQVIAATGMFSFADGDGDSLMFTVNNVTGDARAGFWAVDGERLMGEFIISQANLRRLSYQVGS